MWFGMAILPDDQSDRTIYKEGKIRFVASDRGLSEYRISTGLSSLGIAPVESTVLQTYPLPAWNVEKLGNVRNPALTCSGPLAPNLRRVFWVDSLTQETYRITMAPIDFIQEMEAVEIYWETMFDSMNGDGKAVAWLIIQSQNGPT
jgi:hypothetical protein